MSAMDKMNSQELAYLIFNAHDHRSVQKLKKLIRANGSLLNSFSEEIRKTVEEAIFETDRVELAAFGANDIRWQLY